MVLQGFLDDGLDLVFDFFVNFRGEILFKFGRDILQLLLRRKHGFIGFLGAHFRFITDLFLQFLFSFLDVFQVPLGCSFLVGVCFFRQFAIVDGLDVILNCDGIFFLISLRHLDRALDVVFVILHRHVHELVDAFLHHLDEVGSDILHVFFELSFDIVFMHIGLALIKAGKS